MPSSFYIWIHSGSQLITALSGGKGYGEAGGEGLFSSSKISEALTHRFAVPPLPQAGEGCCQLIFHLQTKMYKLQDTALSRAADEPKRIGLSPLIMTRPARHADPSRILSPARTFFVTTKTSMGRGLASVGT